MEVHLVDLQLSSIHRDVVALFSLELWRVFQSKFNLLVVFIYDLRFSISVFLLFNLDIRFSTSTFILFNLGNRFLSSTFVLFKHLSFVSPVFSLTFVFEVRHSFYLSVTFVY